jgi:hypothetical protein
MRRKRPPVPDRREIVLQPMRIPMFVHQDGHVGPLEGYCRGYGATGTDLRDYQMPIGIYTAAGDYFNITIDTQLECAAPQFLIQMASDDWVSFFWPIVRCSTMGAKVNPANGYLLPP